MLQIHKKPCDQSGERIAFDGSQSMDELIAEFISETKDSLEKLDDNLLEFEKNPNDSQSLNEIFRLFHTIKGTSGFLDLNRLGRLSHAAENLMSGYRSRQISVQTEGISLILRTIDRIKDILSQISDSGKEPQGDDAELISALENEAMTEQLNPSDRGGTVPKVKDEVPASLEANEVTDPQDEDSLSGDVLENFIQNLFNEDSHSDVSSSSTMGAVEDVMAGELGRMLLDTKEQPIEPPPTRKKAVKKPSSKANPPTRKKKTRTKSKSVAGTNLPNKVEDIDSSSHEIDIAPEWVESAAVTKETSPSSHEIASHDAKVRLDLLENLMNAVSELVLTRNQILQIQRSKPDVNMELPIQRLNHITTELQEGIMKTRMQPVKHLWARIPRMVRDVSLELGKSIECSMYGEDTEVDRQVLEHMRDPLLHLVRNACDHGIESPEERRLAGKPETGVINLRALQEGGRIIIEVSDDGRGIDKDALRRKLIDEGRISVSEDVTISDSDVYNALFEPGFSTSEKVSEISGRGVGLDVVRSNIIKIGGSIDIRSSVGEGSAFIIVIPLSLAIVSSLIVKCSEQVFALPQQAVLEVGQITESGAMQIKYVNKYPVLQTRGAYFPLVELDRVLELKEEEEIISLEAWTQRYIIIVQGGSMSYGLVVDDIFDTEEIVVKPLSRILANLPYFSGNTILGDGRVVMILDPHGLGSHVRVVSRLTQEYSESIPDMRESVQETTNYLLFRDWEHKQVVAVNLLQINRIEEIDLSKVEYPLNRASIVYQDKLMPLVNLTESVLPKSGVETTLVFSFKGRNLGLIVKEIVDIVESPAVMDISAPGEKIAGSTIIDGTTIDIMDIDFFIQSYLPSTETVKEDNDAWGSRVIIIESNPVRYARYRQVLQRLQAQTIVHVRGQSALRAIARDKSLRHVFCSENLPDMTPIEFVRDLRKIFYGRNIEVFVLCDEPTEDIEERYVQAGYNGCLAVQHFQQRVNELGLDEASAE